MSSHGGPGRGQGRHPDPLQLKHKTLRIPVGLEKEFKLRIKEYKMMLLTDSQIYALSVEDAFQTERVKERYLALHLDNYKRLSEEDKEI